MSGDNVTTKHIKIQPGVQSWRYITIGNVFTNSQNYNTTLKSHLMKNSEWGAVVYLTESKYGRNGTEVTINNNGTTYYTGGGSGTTFVNKPNQSSTGNIYGIYDLSGNAYEYVAGYYKEGDFSSADSTFTTEISDAYSTVYKDTTESKNYIYGDATYETHGWHDDYTNFVSSDYPFFKRGGWYNDGVRAEIFSFNGNNGDGNDSSVGFRICLVVQ